MKILWSPASMQLPSWTAKVSARKQRGKIQTSRAPNCRLDSQIQTGSKVDKIWHNKCAYDYIDSTKQSAAKSWDIWHTGRRWIYFFNFFESLIFPLIHFAGNSEKNSKCLMIAVVTKSYFFPKSYRYIWSSFPVFSPRSVHPEHWVGQSIASSVWAQETHILPPQCIPWWQGARRGKNLKWLGSPFINDSEKKSILVQTLQKANMLERDADEWSLMKHSIFFFSISHKHLNHIRHCTCNFIN